MAVKGVIWVGSLVLDEAGRLVGVVSEADLLLKEVGQQAPGGYLISSGRRGEQAKAG
jgi:hypothetical protein